MSNRDDDANVVMYLLAGVGLGAIIGAAAGLLFAPKPGSELRQDIGDKFKEIKGKTSEWVAEQRAKRGAEPEELGV
ncbi:MAG TPA: YtxH domain-containing protein [Fimbriimonadaceae bacterium]|nr:YtxH domain-containing protein [Fimbriimonadaceae bacterium]